MKLTVLNVAYPLAPVGPDAVGGAEQVLTQLDAALARQGHESVVIACEGSKVAGTLISVPASHGALTARTRELAQARQRRAIEQVLNCQSVDLVHLHGIDFPDYLPPKGLPVLVTLHLPPTWYPPHIYGLARPATYLHCVSSAQRRMCPTSPLLLPEIENGVEFEKFQGRHAKRSFALCLGRICPEKGFHFALNAATRAGLPLLLGGQIFGYEAHQQYFQQQILPRLNGRHRFLGPVSFKRKRRLLQAARCLLAPSLAPETSSLVAMEALAAGTPVIAFPSGALADIVEDGRTGFLVKDEREMGEAIKAVSQLKAETCREAARNRFSARHMTECYLEVYRKLVSEKEEKDAEGASAYDRASAEGQAMWTAD